MNNRMNSKINWLRSTHHFSGVLLITFIAIHLINHLMLFHSEEAHLQFMTIGRKFYRFTPIEILLFVVVLFQITSGVFLLKEKWKDLNNAWDRIQTYSGAYFIYFLIAHLSAILYGRYTLELDTNLYFGAAVLNISPMRYFFLFHYGLAIIAFFSHTACVHRIKIQAFVSRKTANVQSVLIISFGVALAFFLIRKMMELTIPREYIDPFQ